MMITFNIEGVPTDLYNWLKRQADAHHHSINDELIALLQKFRGKTEDIPELNSDEKFTAIMNISRRCRTLPQLDSRSPEEIVGYNKNGIPTYRYLFPDLYSLV